MVTRKEVAQLSGVSEATVSRVFNNVGPLKEETKQRVLEAAKQLSYHPNAIASSFARGRSGNVGVVLPYMPKVHLFSTYYFSEILSGIGEKVREKGYDMLLMFRSPEESADYTELYRSQKVDACIILGSRDIPEQRQSLQQLQKRRLPFCLVNQHFAGEDFNEMDADHVQGSYIAVKHLLDKGYRHIAFLNGSPQYSNSQDRLQGYVMAMQEAGMDPTAALRLEGNYSRTSGYKAASRIWKERSRVEAVFAANDRMAIGVMQGLSEQGWAAGQDFAIVGCDDSDSAKLSNPPLSSVYVPFYEMGKRAAERLLDQLISPEASSLPFYEKLPTRLVIRKSSERD